MAAYTNGFSCGIDDKGEEVVLSFGQKTPAFDEEDNTVYEEVAKLIMRKDMAKRMIEALGQLISEEEEE